MGILGAGVKTAANAANNIVGNKTTLNTLATKAKDVGLSVMDGVRGNYRGYTKRLGTNILKSNMSPSALKDAAKNGMDNYMKDPNNKEFIKNTVSAALKTDGKAAQNANRYVANAMKKHAFDMGPNNKVWGASAMDMIVGKAAAKSDMAFRVGDAIGGGVRDSYRSLKAGKGVSNALKAGFTQNGKVRMDRVAGAAFGVGVAGRVATGGGLYKDRYGRVNVPGVPFL